MILNKEARADRVFIGACEAVVEASRSCVTANSAPAPSVLMGMLAEVFRYGQVRSRTCYRSV